MKLRTSDLLTFGLAGGGSVNIVPNWEFVLRRRGSLMKKFLYGAAAALAIASPGAAMAQSGYVEAGYSSTEVGSGDIDTWQFGGATAWGGDGSIGFQIDGSYGMHEYSGGGPEVDTYNLAGHIFTRNESSMLGAFVGLGNTEFGSSFDYGYWNIGAEGAYYMARTTLSGAITYSDSSDLDAQISSIDLGLTHFATDNFSIGGALGYADIEGDDLTSFGVNAEYQFSSSPISIYGGYTTADFSGVDADMFTIGARWNFGGSLFDRDRSGASLTRNAGFARIGAIL